jgi:hypothetical protein
MLNNIPKVLHLYWDGSIMPLFCFLTVFTFRKLNPSWIIKIYSPLIRSKITPWESDEDKIEYEGQDYCEYLKTIPNCLFITFDFKKIGVADETSEIQKSDFLKWHLLSTEGGVWSDFDIIYFRGIGEINIANQEVTKKNKEIDFTVCYNINDPSGFKYSTGFLMASKECFFYKKVFKTAINKFNKHNYYGAGSWILNNKYPNLIDLYNEEIDSNIWNMSTDILYAHNHTELRCIYETMHLGFFTQNSIGLHFYYGSKTTKENLNNLDKEKYNRRNTLSIVIDKFNENTGYSSL